MIKLYENTIGKVIVYLVLSLLFTNCSSAFTAYKELNKDISANNRLYRETKKIIKPLLVKENEDVILIINWYKTVDSEVIRFNASYILMKTRKLNLWKTQMKILMNLRSDTKWKSTVIKTLISFYKNIFREKRNIC